ncbi:MAG: UbiD family decarboxylase, partial [Desulfobacteraceae bacterium]|nr:UbiD family decarboxylase [Desulfobacteraceae bacterium]
MKFSSLGQCVQFLENQGELVRIKDVVDPHLEMAQITRRVFDAGGPALLFEKVKNTKFAALSNLYGTWDRTLQIFEPELEQVKSLVDMKFAPMQALRSPGRMAKAACALFHALPVPRHRSKVMAHTTRIDRLPLITCWPKDGGAFVLLPQVFSQDPDSDSVLQSNLGMYRIQLSGNQYTPNQEVG